MAAEAGAAGARGAGGAVTGARGCGGGGGGSGGGGGGDKGVARGGGQENGDEQPREGGQESVVVERRVEHAAVCRWTIAQLAKVKARALWSKYFEVGGYDCRLLVYPKGDSQALPGYISIYLQVTDPRGSSSSKWDCFASYRLCVFNQRDDGKTIQRDSWHRFSGKKKSHGWCDFTPSSAVLDPKAGFLVGDAVLITAEIMVLHESVSFSRENELPVSVGPSGEALSGKFTWKVHNLSLFKEMIKTQKIMSPVFPAGECNLRLSVYQSGVNGVDYLSMCLESKDTEKPVATERSCWCLFRMSVLNQRAGVNHTHRDSYGRFAADNKSGDNTSLGWNDYMKMADFVAADAGYVTDDTAVFSASFHVIKESSTFSKSILPVSGRSANAKKGDGFQGKFIWRIENFTRLKDLLKKRKITGLCIKSRRFQVGARDCRLIVYPRGQSQPPCHLSMFLEVTDPRTTGDWSCFVSHRLSVVNQRSEERSVTKESQNRYSKAAKDWGWREFVTLTSLFDQDSGFLVLDTVVFSAEVLILKETSTLLDLPERPEGGPAPVPVPVPVAEDAPLRIGKRGTFTWRVENFVAFKEIMETRKIFSKFFSAGGCELRIGVYESFDTLCIYLESDQALQASASSSTSATPSGCAESEKNFWVRYCIAVVNQKHAERTVWKLTKGLNLQESSICTKTWNNSVLQFMKVSELLDPEAGFLVRDTLVFVCEILDCCPWFEFSDLVLMSDDEQDALSTDPDELLESDESEAGCSVDDEDLFQSLLARAGFQLSYGDNPPLLLDPSQLQVTLREKLLLDAGAVAAFLAGLRMYLDDPAKVKRLLLPTKVTQLGGLGDQCTTPGETANVSSPSLMNLLMGVKVLQQAIIDLLLDIMVECCVPSNGRHLVADLNPPVEAKSHTAEASGSLAAGKSALPLVLPHHARRGGEVAVSSSSTVTQGHTEDSAVDHRFFGEDGGQAVQSSDSHTGDLSPPLRSEYLPATSSSDSQLQSTFSSNADTLSTKAIVATSNGPAMLASCSNSRPTEGVSALSNPGSQSSKMKWPEQAEELLMLIVESLRALESMVPAVQAAQPEPPRRRPHSAQRMAMVLEHAPSPLQPQLLSLVPRLVDVSEHPLAAQVLLERMNAPEAEPSLRLLVLGALAQMEAGPEVGDAVLEQALLAMPHVEDDALAAVMSFALKAAGDCGRLPYAVAAIRSRLKRLGPAVPPRVLDVVRGSVSSRPGVAEALLRGIEDDCDPSEVDIASSAATLVSAADRDNGGAAEQLDAEKLQAAAEQAAAACWRVADVDILVEMLTLPQFRFQARAVFEACVNRGAFGEQSVVMVLERRRAQRLILQRGVGAAGWQGEVPSWQQEVPLNWQLLSPLPGEEEQIHLASTAHVEEDSEEDDFFAMLGLAEALSPSKEARVRDFVSTLYAVMFKVYADEVSRERMLRGLVERATSSTTVTSIRGASSVGPRESGPGGRPGTAASRSVGLIGRATLPHEAELGMDILTFLVREEEGTARPALALMREAAETSVAARDAMWQQLTAVSEELKAVTVERQLEVARLTKEKAALQQKLADTENTLGRIKGELRLETEKGVRERKDAAEKLREMESQLEWARSEKDDEIARLATEKKGFAERLKEAEAQLAQLKFRKRDELKKVMKEKNVLAERLKGAEGARKRFDEELKRSSAENVTREEVRQSLEAEVQRLTQTVGRTEGGLREKEEQVMRCEAYIDGMEAKLHAHQDYIQTLEASLQEEMSRHAPLYGAGLEALSLAELDTLARIHDEGLRQLAPTSEAIFNATMPLGVGLPPVLTNGVVPHSNGHSDPTPQRQWYASS
eukprot:SM000153S01590  [mRNA]  locus=s153:33191:42651:- [translate_table: standard]